MRTKQGVNLLSSGNEFTSGILFSVKLLSSSANFNLGVYQIARLKRHRASIGLTPNKALKSDL